MKLLSQLVDALSSPVLLLLSILAGAPAAQAQSGHWEYKSSAVYGTGSRSVTQQDISVSEKRSFEKGIFQLSRSYQIQQGSTPRPFNATYKAALEGPQKKVSPGGEFLIKVKLTADQNGGPLGYELWGRAWVSLEKPNYAEDTWRKNHILKDGAYSGSMKLESGTELASMTQEGTQDIVFKAKAPKGGDSHKLLYLTMGMADMGLVIVYEWVSEDYDIFLKGVDFPESNTYEVPVFVSNVNRAREERSIADHYYAPAEQKKRASSDEKCNETVTLHITKSGAADFDAEVRNVLTSGEYIGMAYVQTVRIRGLRQHYRFGDKMHFKLDVSRTYDEDSYSFGGDGYPYALPIRESLFQAFNPGKELPNDNNRLNDLYTQDLKAKLDGGTASNEIEETVRDPGVYSEDIVLSIPIFPGGNIVIRYGWTAAGDETSVTPGSSSGRNGDRSGSSSGGSIRKNGSGGVSVGALLGGGAAIGIAVGAGIRRLRKKSAKKKGPGKLKKKPGEDYSEWVKRQAEYEQKESGSLFPVQPEPGEDYSHWKDRQSKAEKKGRERIRETARKYGVSDTDPLTGQKKDLGQLKEETDRKIKRDAIRRNAWEEAQQQHLAEQEDFGSAMRESEFKITADVSDGTVNVLGETVPGGRAVKDSYTFIKSVGVRTSEAYNTGGSIVGGMARGTFEGSLGVAQNNLDKVPWGKAGGKAAQYRAESFASGGIESLKTFTNDLCDGKSVSEAFGHAAEAGTQKAINTATGKVMSDMAGKGIEKFTNNQWGAYNKVAETVRQNPTAEGTLRQLDKLKELATNLRHGEEAFKGAANTFNEVIGKTVTDPAVTRVTDFIKNIESGVPEHMREALGTHKA